MGLFNKSDKNNKGSAELLSKIKDCNDKVEFYLYITKELHKYINEFALNLEEIDSDKFKKQINELAQKFISNEKPKRVEHVFDKYKNMVNSYITRSKKYLNEKENEFKNIIKLLTEGISAISYENREFNADMIQHSVKLEKINLLNDLRKMKEALEQEVIQIKETIKQKTERDTKHLKMLSEKVSILSEDLEKAEAASMTDRLTGAFNRLAFENHINMLIERIGMRWSSFSLMMMDIDNFKQINDTYGHIVGDRVIVAAVQMCKTILRKNDFIARYGGEEFIIILDGASLKIAQKKANDICKKIAQTDFIIDKEKSNEKLSFTVSIGISSFRDGDTVDVIIERADKALYKAKTTGKNRAISDKILD